MDIAAEFLPKFDKTKDHGIVTPPERGAHFEQGGYYFNQEGELVEEMLTPADRDRLKKEALNREADRAASEARAKFLEENGLTADDPDLAKKVIAVAQAAGAPAENIDLVAWAKAEAVYPFAKVRKAAQDKHNFTATDARALVAFMVDNNLVKEDEVKVRAT